MLFKGLNDAIYMLLYHPKVPQKNLIFKVISYLEDKLTKMVWWRWVGRRLVPVTKVDKCEPNLVISVVFLVGLGL